MIRTILTISMLLMIIAVFGGCHAQQEKAWDESMIAIEAGIAEDEFLAQHVDHVLLERRQYVHVFIKPQKSRINFRNVTEKVAILAQTSMYGHEGNTLKEFLVKGFLYSNGEIGDELVVVRCSKEGIEIKKDRTTATM